MPHTPFHRPTEFTRRKPPQPPAWMEEEMHGEKESPKIQVPSGPSDPYGGEVPQTPYRYQPPKIRVPSRPSDPYGGEVPQTPYQYQPREDSFLYNGHCQVTRQQAILSPRTKWYRLRGMCPFGQMKSAMPQESMSLRILDPMLPLKILACSMKYKTYSETLRNSIKRAQHRLCTV